MTQGQTMSERVPVTFKPADPRGKKASTDLFALYLQDIARYRLLRRDEEIELAQQVKRWMDLLEQRQYLQEELARVPTTEEWADRVQLQPAELSRLERLGQKAKERLLKANLRLVVSVAKKYRNRGIEFLDLIQEGTLGLHRGIEKFDPTKGYRFSTYAYWWIRQGMTRALDNYGRTIRLPTHVQTKLNKLKQAQRQIYQQGRTPTLAELAAAMELSPQEVRELMRNAPRPASLDAQLGDEGDATLGELLESDETASAGELIRAELKRDVAALLEQLSEREREILLKRYGFDGSPMQSLREIGKAFNLSRERIRQLEAKAIKKLRQPEVCQPYRAYLDDDD